VHALLTGSTGVMNADVTVQRSLVDERRPAFLAHLSLRYDIQVFSVHMNLLVTFTFKAKATYFTGESLPAQVDVLHMQL